MATFGPEWGEVIELEEENWYFRLAKYRQWLLDFLDTHAHCVSPAFRQQELRNAAEKLSGDLSISRPKSRLSWGIELPFDPSCVTYVWFDALVNYISFAGYLRDEAAFQGTLARSACYRQGYSHSRPRHLLAGDAQGDGIRRRGNAKFSRSRLRVGRRGQDEQIPGQYSRPEHFRGHLRGRGASLLSDARLRRRSGHGFHRRATDQTVQQRISQTALAIFSTALSTWRIVIAQGRLRKLELETMVWTEREPRALFDELRDGVAGIELESYRQAMEQNQIQLGLQAIFRIVQNCNFAVESWAPWNLAKDPEKAGMLDAALVFPG